MSLAEQYYQNWQSGKSANGLERFLSQCPDVDAMQLVEVLLVDQALEWQSGSRPSVEQYLQRFPAISEQETAVLDLVYGEMRVMSALGLSVDLDSYIARFPDLAEPLRRQMDVSTWLEEEGSDSASVDQPPS